MALKWLGGRCFFGQPVGKTEIVGVIGDRIVAMGALKGTSVTRAAIKRMRVHLIAAESLSLVIAVART